MNLKPTRMEFLRIKRQTPDKNQYDQNESELKSERLVQKAGFVSLKDRLNNLKEDEKKRNAIGRLKTLPLERVEEEQQRPASSKQFATLHELFSNKPDGQYKSGYSSYGNNCQQQPKKPKIPIMKLSKEDWNVRCWEERLCSHKRRQEAQRLSTPSFADKSTRRVKQLPAEQVKVFRGRIEEVATKLERVSEGAPADEKLYELTMNKGRRGEMRGAGSHEWTDLLKSELAKGTHNPKQLKAQLAVLGSQPALGLTSGPIQVKSPLGRPIRRLFQEEEEEEHNDSGGKNSRGAVREDNQSGDGGHHD